MSIFDGIKRIFIHDAWTDTKREIPLEKASHTNDLQDMADKTDSIIELEKNNGDKRYIYPKDVFINRVYERHKSMIW